jgi:spoIIIJ-associated protein
MRNHAPELLVDRLLQDVVNSSGLSFTHKMVFNFTGSKPAVAVEFAGPDAGLLTARNGELLLAMEHIAAMSLRLAPGEHDQLSFDACGWKAARDRRLAETAEAALLRVHATGVPYEFPPMSSHERRLLHLALEPSGLATASEGDGPLRHVVLGRAG